VAEEVSYNEKVTTGPLGVYRRNLNPMLRLLLNCQGSLTTIGMCPFRVYASPHPLLTPPCVELAEDEIKPGVPDWPLQAVNKRRSEVCGVGGYQGGLQRRSYSLWEGPVFISLWEGPVIPNESVGNRHSWADVGSFLIWSDMSDFKGLVFLLWSGRLKEDGL
jgi:hypothetical protein